MLNCWIIAVDAGLGLIAGTASAEVVRLSDVRLSGAQSDLITAGAVAFDSASSSSSSDVSARRDAASGTITIGGRAIGRPGSWAGGSGFVISTTTLNSAASSAFATFLLALTGHRPLPVATFMNNIRRLSLSARAALGRSMSLLRLSLGTLLAVTPPAAADPVVSMLEIRQSGVVVQKYDISCGAAAEATLLWLKFGIRVPERDVALGLIARKEYVENPLAVRAREGFSLLDLKRYANRLALKGEGLGQVTLEDLPGLAPVIVPLQLNGYNHYVVFRGISKNGKVVLADPAFGNRVMSVDRFERAWMDLPELGHVAFAVNRR